MIRVNLFIFLLVISLSIGYLSMLVLQTSRYEAMLSNKNKEAEDLEQKLQATIEWLLMDNNRYKEHPDELVSIINHSAKVNLNYDNLLILSLASVSIKLENLSDLLRDRKKMFLLQFDPWIKEEYHDFFSPYTHANPVTSDRDQLKLLYTVNTGYATLPLRLEELINNEALISKQSYLQSIGYNEDLLPIIHPEGRFDIHSIDANLLRDILSIPAFHIKNPESKAQILLSRRQSNQRMTQEDLRILFSDSENFNEGILHYLGTSSYYYTIQIKGESQILEALCIFWPDTYVNQPTLSIAWRRYHAIH